MLLCSIQMEGASSAEVIIHPTACHGGFLVDQPFQARIAAAVANMIPEAGGIVPKSPRHEGL